MSVLVNGEGELNLSYGCGEDIPSNNLSTPLSIESVLSARAHETLTTLDDVKGRPRASTPPPEQQRPAVIKVMWHVAPVGERARGVRCARRRVGA